MIEQYVNAWTETVTIPTYQTGAPDKNPMFFEKRIYQGSSGVVYPNPVIEKIYDEKVDKQYTGLFLENAYLKIMILPELGGRVQMAYDKIKERHFIYYNQVIKPALVGLCGPWISGGIEFNWPQHHRPSTFEPVDYLIEDNADGSKTVWVSEVEKMFHTKGMAGFTLYPGKAYLEIKAKLFNRSSLPQTFLWWANPAVKVNDDYQSVFPPDVNAVFDHGKRDVSTFPIATGTYYKVDYSPGTDISRYKNIPVPTSYMAVNSNYNFVGGYEHDTQAGVLHVADHHVSPGKKQWTWGNGDFGVAWDRNLTDEDGPYIELMTGVFTDNQPDFSWLMPNEEKTFTQYFMPYRELGLVKNASKDLMIGFEQSVEGYQLKVFATSAQKNLTLKVLQTGSVILETTLNLSPENVYTHTFAGLTGNEPDFTISITNQQCRELLSYAPAKNKINPVPAPAAAAKEPAEVSTAEQLFLIGQHLEQYRHATFSPVPYYEEALKRDATDARNNNALGLWYLRRGQFAKSEPYFRAAVNTITGRNPNPYDSEAYYNLGLCLKFQDRTDDAYDAFFKATWSSAWQDAGYFEVAKIDAWRGEFALALEHVDWSIDRNARNGKAYVLKAFVLRSLGKIDEALDVIASALKRDQFNIGAGMEQYFCAQQLADGNAVTAAAGQIKALTRGVAHTLVDYAIDYAAFGAYNEAIVLLQFANAEEAGSPMISYYTGSFFHQLDQHKKALSYFEEAAAADPAYCFVNRLEDIVVLQLASKINPDDAKALYYLGNLWYDKRQYAEAIAAWEQSAAMDAGFATVQRNLGIAYYNKLNKANEALVFFEKAYSLNPWDARVLMELDQLYKRLNVDPVERLLFLEAKISITEKRDDLYLERAAIYNYNGQYDKAHELISLRQFHPWEGGEGKVSGQYIYSLVEMAKQMMVAEDYEQAIRYLAMAQIYPNNLGEGKLPGAQENDIFYWLGCIYETRNDTQTAEAYFKRAATGLAEPSAAMFYNDQQPDKIFYQGLALKKLGQETDATQIFNNLINYAQTHMNDHIKIDFFAVSLPDLLIFEDDLDLRNKLHCLYMLGLGQLGLGQQDEAAAALNAVLQQDAMHFGAKTHLAFV